MNADGEWRENKIVQCAADNARDRECTSAGFALARVSLRCGLYPVAA